MNALKLSVTAEWLSFAESLTLQNFDDVVIRSACAAKAAGFDALELPLPHAQHLLSALGETYWTELAERLVEMQIPVRSIHGPNFPGLATTVPHALHQILPQWRIANRMKVDAFVVHPTPHSHPHVVETAKSLLERDVELCNHLIGECDGETKLAVENLPTYGLAHLRRLMDRIDQSPLGVCFDTGHWNVRPEGSIETALTLFDQRIVHLHLSDNPGWCDAHQPPGKGSFSWHRWAQAISPLQWSRPMLIELSAPLRCQDPDATSKTSVVWSEANRLARMTLCEALNSVGVEQTKTGVPSKSAQSTKV
ncbi:sugar phosphate isomerase/epimerase family protein [Crateriforma conspicua]|uniref:Xylose isomerase-like TIM barrel n=1 Tax=Crateriforma conspicua TaxID=2527996 RepID=A0A5C5Y2V8_9PLAN|nr:sugar phosphate isomerase/epimerase family protein [Crateriforma conspicua]QDV63471.1 Xylose isomerase-like TIM barrel [Crateriforma conspicua]TWT69021.1 Xylose isomerase-like TIM barrel [Crateriforma conspicua]